MNNRKNQNSILVLATLGVYLGLVLAGATPQVLAQAAMAKQFSVKDEVEGSDKLDNDPNDCSLLAAKVKEKAVYFPFDNNAVANYAATLTTLFRDYLVDTPQEVRASWGACGARKAITHWLGASSGSDTKPVLTSGKWRDGITQNANILSAIFPKASGDDHTFIFEVLATGENVTVTSTITALDDLDAHKSHIAYNTSLDYWRCASTDKSAKTFLDQTEISWSNDQVFIVTRLPRAGLDSLLATDAK